jgi:hypothetical protein
MNLRIADFQFLWIATVMPPPMPPLSQLRDEDRWDSDLELELPRPKLCRTTNGHEVLPADLRAEWDTAGAEDKEEIVKSYMYWREVDIGV